MIQTFRDGTLEADGTIRYVSPAGVYGTADRRGLLCGVMAKVHLKGYGALHINYKRLHNIVVCSESNYHL